MSRPIFHILYKRSYFFPNFILCIFIISDSLYYLLMSYIFLKRTLISKLSVLFLYLDSKFCFKNCTTSLCSNKPLHIFLWVISNCLVLFVNSPTIHGYKTLYPKIGSDTRTRQRSGTCLSLDTRIENTVPYFPWSVGRCYHSSGIQNSFCISLENA